MQDAIKALVGAFSFINHYLKPLSRAVAIPVAVLILLNVPRMVPGVSIQAPLLFELLQWIVLAMIAIVTHRIILKGPDSVPGWGLRRFGWREFSFIGMQFLLICLILPLNLLLLIPGIGPVLLICSVLYLFSRLSLVFPSIAVDRPMGFIESWNLTSRRQLMIVLVAGLLPTGLLITDVLFGLVIAYSNLSVLYLASVAVSTVSTVYAIAVLSVAYRIIVEGDDETVDRA